MSDTLTKNRDPILDKLARALEKIDRPSTFCAHGRAEFVPPGLTVKGLGPIGFPLTTAQARELRELCVQAPYGKGEKTLVDTDVRRVWKLDPKKFTLKNPQWDKAVGNIVGKVREELGLDKQRVDAHLYDLLLYEKGSFFLPHQDGERLPGMVGTLVVTLPSEFEGGELLVRHDGQEQKVNFGSKAERSFGMHYAAFYADCEHEVRPLKSGHRLCLVYNLTLAGSGKKLGAPRDSQHVEEMAQVLRIWAQDTTALRLVVTLDHEYTEKGLTWDALKGADRGKATVLCAAADAAGCKAYLALLTLHLSGEAEYAGGGYDRRGYYGEYADDAADYEMGEIYDSSLTAEHLVDRDGRTLPLDTMYIDESELLDPEALTNIDPEEEFEGYTGNAGMTLDHWYRHAAVVLWPERRHFDNLCEGHAKEAVPLLTSMVAKWRKASKAKAGELKTSCLQFARAILENWPTSNYNSGEPDSTAGAVLKSLTALEDLEGASQLLSEVLVKDADANPGAALPAACRAFGWSSFETALISLVRNSSAETMSRNLCMVDALATSKPASDEQIDLCGRLAADLIAKVQEFDAHSKDWRWQEFDRAALIDHLVRILAGIAAGKVLSEFLAYVRESSGKYPFDVQWKALERLAPWLSKRGGSLPAALRKWIVACREELERLTAEEPRRPADFRRPAVANCKCDLCKALNKFLADPKEETHRVRAAQHYRSHVEGIIRNNQCDVACRTERTRSPHTLVCTKTIGSYQRALKKYREDQKKLAACRAIEADLSR